MTPTDAKPHDRDLARRIVLAAGFGEADFDARAKEQLRQITDQHDLEQRRDPSLPKLEPAELWLVNQGKQLHRFFSNRCIGCVHWHPATSGNHGACDALAAGSTDPMIDVGRGEPKTRATFGCVLAEQIPPDDAETLRARTEIAIKFGLLDAFPEAAE